MLLLSVARRVFDVSLLAPPLLLLHLRDWVLDLQLINGVVALVVSAGGRCVAVVTGALWRGTTMLRASLAAGVRAATSILRCTLSGPGLYALRSCGCAAMSARLVKCRQELEPSWNV